MPESPAVARRQTLHRRTHLMDRAAMVAQMVAADQHPVRPDMGGVLAALVVKGSAGMQKPTFHQPAERHARRLTLGRGVEQFLVRGFLNGGDAGIGDLGVLVLSLYPDP